MTQRIAVFIDHQNVYMSARRAFHDEWADKTCGQILPVRFALHLCGAGDNGRDLKAVNVYRGIPDRNRNSVGHAAVTRQNSLWANDPGGEVLKVFTRTLNYRNPNQPAEKGVDVKLAVDMVAGAMRNDFDVAILASEDTDLIPALEEVIDVKRSSSAVEVTSWQPDGGQAIPLRVVGHSVVTHRPGRKQYGWVRDVRDFSQRRRRR